MHTSLPLAWRDLEGPNRNAFRGHASGKVNKAVGYQTVGKWYRGRVARLKA